MSALEPSMERRYPLPYNPYVLFFAVAGGIFAWMAHLTAVASLVQLSRSHPAVVWVMHGITAGLAAVTLVAMALCRRMMVSTSDPEDGGSPASRTRFLGIFGLFTGTASLLLILFEGLYVVVINRHG